ncbi:hypothetical protein CBL_05145 [Carabus blaptoides fortunei]
MAGKEEAILQGVVMRALIEGKEDCINLGIKFDEDSWQNLEIIIDDEDFDGATSDNPSEIPQNVLQLNFGEGINMKTYQKEQIDKTNPFVHADRLLRVRGRNAGNKQKENKIKIETVESEERRIKFLRESLNTFSWPKKDRYPNDAKSLRIMGAH